MIRNPEYLTYFNFYKLSTSFLVDSTAVPAYAQTMKRLNWLQLGAIVGLLVIPFFASSEEKELPTRQR
jgi:hypothetical protein